MAATLKPNQRNPHGPRLTVEETYERQLSTGSTPIGTTHKKTTLDTFEHPNSIKKQQMGAQTLQAVAVHQQGRRVAEHVQEQKNNAQIHAHAQAEKEADRKTTAQRQDHHLAAVGAAMAAEATVAKTTRFNTITSGLTNPSGPTLELNPFIQNVQQAEKAADAAKKMLADIKKDFEAAQNDWEAAEKHFKAAEANLKTAEADLEKNPENKGKIEALQKTLDAAKIAKDKALKALEIQAERLAAAGSTSLGMEVDVDQSQRLEQQAQRALAKEASAKSEIDVIKNDLNDATEFGPMQDQAATAAAEQLAAAGNRLLASQVAADKLERRINTPQPDPNQSWIADARINKLYETFQQGAEDGSINPMAMTVPNPKAFLGFKEDDDPTADEIDQATFDKVKEHLQSGNSGHAADFVAFNSAAMADANGSSAAAGSGPTTAASAGGLGATGGAGAATVFGGPVGMAFAAGMALKDAQEKQEDEEKKASIPFKMTPAAIGGK